MTTQERASAQRERTDQTDPDRPSMLRMTKRATRARDVVLRQDKGGAPYLETTLRGSALLRHPFANKGTAFDAEERESLGLVGLLPPRMSTMEEQLERALTSYRAQTTPLARYEWLRGLQDQQEILYYALLLRHLEEMMPVVYTPTVGEAVERFDLLHQEPRGLVITSDDVERMDAILEAWPWDDVRMIVVTDSSAILGLGDRGHGGMAIPIGKLSLYTAAGVSPTETLPVVLDVGTDRGTLRDDPLYLGIRRERLKGEAHLDVVDAFADAVKRRFPRAIVQWEDFSKDTAFAVLERHRHRLASFNDDVQGTGAVTLAGMLAACASKGERLRDQRIVVHGAGAGGAGVASTLIAGMMREGLSREEAVSRVYVLDSRGLLIAGNKMESYKEPLAQRRETVAGWRFSGSAPDLVETAREGRATAIVGLSGQSGAFDESVVRVVASHTERPIVLALSNPTSACEAHPADVLRWTRGKAIVATGSPFAPVELEDRTQVIGQGNNAFVFPGIGLGAMLSNATEITDSMVLEASYALAAYVKERHLAAGRIYPLVSELREVSAFVAAAVMKDAVRSGVGVMPEGASGDLVGYCRAHQWVPRYPSVRPATDGAENATASSESA